MQSFLATIGNAFLYIDKQMRERKRLKHIKDERKYGNLLTRQAWNAQMTAIRNEMEKRVQETVTALNHRFDVSMAESNATLSDLMQQNVEGIMEGWVAKLNLHREEILGQLKESQDEFLATVYEKFEEAERTAKKRQDYVMSCLVEGIQALTTQISTHDLNSSNRYLETLERFRVVEMDNKHDNNINFKTTVGLYENLTDQIQDVRRLALNLSEQVAAKQRVQKVHVAEPTMEHIFERSDDYIAIGKALEQVQNNELPHHQARLAIVKAFKTLLPDVSIDRVADALHEQARRWGLIDGNPDYAEAA